MFTQDVTGKQIPNIYLLEEGAWVMFCIFFGAGGGHNWERKIKKLLAQGSLFSWYLGRWLLIPQLPPFLADLMYTSDFLCFALTFSFDLDQMFIKIRIYQKESEKKQQETTSASTLVFVKGRCVISLLVCPSFSHICLTLCWTTLIPFGSDKISFSRLCFDFG